MSTIDSVSARQASATRWAQVTARDVMRKDVVTISYSTPLSEVERVFAEHRISGAPVTSENGHIVGIISLKDLVTRYAEDPDAHPRRHVGFYDLQSRVDDGSWARDHVAAESEEIAEDLMTSEIYDVPAGAGLMDIARTMVAHQIHRVLVKEDGKHIGLISTMEMLDALSV